MAEISKQPKLQRYSPAGAGHFARMAWWASWWDDMKGLTAHEDDSTQGKDRTSGDFGAAKVESVVEPMDAVLAQGNS